MTHTSNAANGLWSSAASWTPSPGFPPIPTNPSHNVWIQAGHTITLDQDVKCVGEIIIDGKLFIANNVTYLSFHKLHVRPGGFLRVGSPAFPFTGNIEIEVSEDPSTSPPTPGALLVESGVAASGGTAAIPGGILKMWGADGSRPSHTWLHKTMDVGDTYFECEVFQNRCFQVGDHVVVASTDYDTNQAEEFEITSITLASETINGIEVTITQCHIIGSAQYLHFVGELGEPEQVSKSMTIAAEVALLDRNIHVHGASIPSTPMWGGKIQVGNLSMPLSGTTFPPAPVVKLYWVDLVVSAIAFKLGNIHSISIMLGP